MPKYIKYYYGSPCKRCGNALRYKSNTNCVVCTRAKSSIWAKNNPDRVRRSRKRYRAYDPQKIKAIGRRRRALKRKAKSEHYDFRAICNHYNYKCLKCGRDDVKLTVDHIVPIALGGDDIASNIQPLCQSCNASKGARNIDYRPDIGPRQWKQKNLFD